MEQGPLAFDRRSTELGDFAAVGAYPNLVFSTPLGLTALLGVPLVVYLHLYQRRFRPHQVSALFLWGNTETHSPSGRTRQRLLRSPSFWLEVLAALLLGLALGGPLACGAGQAEHFVVVLDSSASMGAVPPGALAVDTSARELLFDKISDLPSNSRVTLIRSGARPSLIAGPAVLPGEAREALKNWRPGHGRHDLGPAIAMGREFAGEGTVLLVTDHLEEGRWPQTVEVHALGTACGNLAITRATRSRGRGENGNPQEQLAITIANPSQEARIAKLEFSAVDTPSDQESAAPFGRVTLQIPAGQNRTHKLDLPKGAPSIVARLDDDELALDNSAYLAPLPDRTLALFSPLGADLRIGLGLATGREGAQEIDRLLGLIEDSVMVSDANDAHLAIAGAAVGSTSTWTLAIEAPGDAREILIGPFLKDLRDPVLKGATLDGIVWGHAAGFVPPGVPLISAGGAILASREEDANQRIYHFSLDPRRSTLQTSPDWPILLSNLAEERRAYLPGPGRTTLRTAETLQFRANKPATYSLTGPQNFELVLAGNRELLIEMPSIPGFYQLHRLPPEPGKSESDSTEGLIDTEIEQTIGPALVAIIAVNLADAAESDLRDLSSGVIESTSKNAGTRTRANWLEALLALTALVCLLADGFVLGGHRLRPIPNLSTEEFAL